MPTTTVLVIVDVRNPKERAESGLKSVPGWFLTKNAVFFADDVSDFAVISQKPMKSGYLNGEIKPEFI
jgi:hypothetical protein